MELVEIMTKIFPKIEIRENDIFMLNDIVLVEGGNHPKIHKEFIIKMITASNGYIDFKHKLLKLKKYNYQLGRFLTSKYLIEGHSEGILLNHSTMYENNPAVVDLSLLESVFITHENLKIYDMECESVEDKLVSILNLVISNKIYPIILDKLNDTDDDFNLEFCNAFMCCVKEKTEILPFI